MTECISPEKVSQIMRGRWCFRAGKLGADGHTTGRLVTIVDNHAEDLFVLEKSIQPHIHRRRCNSSSNPHGCKQYWEGVSQMREVIACDAGQYEETAWQKVTDIFTNYFGTNNDIQERVIEYAHEPRDASSTPDTR